MSPCVESCVSEKALGKKGGSGALRLVEGLRRSEDAKQGMLT